MPTAAWARLLRLIPAKDQDGLMLLTSNHTEIAVQTILRFDADFLIVRGRLAGSQDQGRVFFIPYDQIDHMGFYRAVKDAELNEMFAALEGPAEAAEPAASDAGGSKTPLKSAVLERFRSRSSTIIAPSPLAPRPPGGSNPTLPGGPKAEVAAALQPPPGGCAFRFRHSCWLGRPVLSPLRAVALGEEFHERPHSRRLPTRPRAFQPQVDPFLDRPFHQAAADRLAASKAGGVPQPIPMAREVVQHAPRRRRQAIRRLRVVQGPRQHLAHAAVAVAHQTPPSRL